MYVEKMLIKDMLKILIRYLKHDVEYTEDYGEIVKLIEKIAKIEKAIKQLDSDTRVW